MPLYTVTMRHSEKTLEKLAHMQYDLFSKGNYISRSLVSLVILVLGIMNFTQWWGALAIVYASYLASSRYAAANHRVKKMARSIKEAGLEFPASRYEFKKNAMNVITLPEGTSLGDPLAYGDIYRLGEDADYFYIFRDQNGGYMIPKGELGSKEDEFRYFLEDKTRQVFQSHAAPVVKLIRKIDKQRHNKAKRN